MGDRGAGHAAPTPLEEIASRISDLSKWREIFSFRGRCATALAEGAHGTCTPRALMGQTPRARTRALTLAPLPPAPQRLQKLLFRSTAPLFSGEWAAAHFRFHPPHSDLAYALQAGKGGTRAILAAVQAHIITYLLFTRETECTHLERLCRVGRWEQRQALATALAETLWAAGGGGRAVVCLITAPITTMPREGYRTNSFTERIRQFEFSEKAAAQGFISHHINYFKGEGSHGVILFLYSLLFSRTLERVQEDLGDTAPLLNISSGNVTCTEAVLSLLLTGRASPRQLCGSREPEPGAGDGEGEAPWRRGPVGFLRWERAPVERQVSAGAAPWPAGPSAQPGLLAGVPRQVSPGLRTPRLPVWLCSLSGRHSVLFGTDSRLLSDWKSEKIFHLYFYTGQQEQTQTAHLTIDIYFSFPLQTLIRITGKRLKEKAPTAQGRGAQPWRWQSGPSGQVRPSAGTGQTPFSEE
ncbi:LOW QUALITY PROTEIN: inactive ubiquitin carboxyl-terminal hydrolase MINDY-4B [Anomalospiza imberbis]|uniref:LOW QUALITY PROTEIN: inactive ubiquitin carboxyl-terminal hydrolase MINDY-4B n=1 Tax=Anomalospiza imberbis TaxID=187417 RepID=UPI00358FB030